MIFRQFLNEPLAAASYLLGCAATGEAAVVDPGLPAEQYALAAADRSLRITQILETHMHADYFSTGRALAALTGAGICLPRLADARFAHHPLDDGESIQVGNLLIRAMHTPGHTPEHMAFAVSDTPRAERPWFVLTGDCLFVGDVGRADLLDLPLSGAEHLHASIFGKLLQLPDDTEIFPAHYGGSACGGKNMSGKVSSTIGFERRHNWALQAPDPAAFAAWIDATPRAAVEGVLLHRNTNRGALPLPGNYWQPQPDARLADMRPLTLQELANTAASGALVVDLRSQPAFAAGHAPGALNITYNRSTLLERVAALSAPDEQLIALADQPFVARAAGALLAGAGRNPVRGYAAGSFDVWRAAGLPEASLPTLSLDELHLRAGQQGVLVLDVRDPFEWRNGVIEGAALISLDQLRERLAELPRNLLLITVCESGTRAGAAASLLLRHGYTRVANVAPDGMSAYAKRYPTVTPDL
jgi:hydroxyacylglutathione hydrolase